MRLRLQYHEEIFQIHVRYSSRGNNNKKCNYIKEYIQKL